MHLNNHWELSNLHISKILRSHLLDVAFYCANIAHNSIKLRLIRIFEWTDLE